MTTTHQTTVSTPTATSVVAVRVFDAPRDLVYAAHTEPEHVRRWLLGPDGWSMSICEIDLRAGGGWHFIWQKDDGSLLEMTGTYLEVQPTTRLVSSESWGPEWPSTVNTMELTEEAGRTTLTYTIEFDSEESRDAALATGMISGMDTSYTRLARLLGAIG